MEGRLSQRALFPKISKNGYFWRIFENHVTKALPRFTTTYPNETYLKLTSNVIQYCRSSCRYSEFDFNFSNFLKCPRKLFYAVTCLQFCVLFASLEKYQISCLQLNSTLN